MGKQLSPHFNEDEFGVGIAANYLRTAWRRS